MNTVCSAGMADRHDLLAFATSAADAIERLLLNGRIPEVAKHTLKDRKI